MAQRKKRKRRRVEAGRRKGGVLTGMRSGFKKAATAVAGSEPAEKQKKKASWVSTAITVILVLAAIALLFYRNR